MLATAICLKRYMKNDLSSTVRDTIERNWVVCWKERLGNPDVTPCQMMRTYVRDLDILVAALDEEMDWNVWADDDDMDGIPEDASV
jgi:hypothetical protein